MEGWQHRGPVTCAGGIQYSGEILVQYNCMRLARRSLTDIYIFNCIILNFMTAQNTRHEIRNTFIFFNAFMLFLPRTGKPITARKCGYANSVHKAHNGERQVCGGFRKYPLLRRVSCLTIY